MSTLFERLQGKYGGDKIATFGDLYDMKVVSTGSISLDFATGLGGIPLGRVVEVFGPESVGKTSLAYYIIAEHLLRFSDKDAYFLNIEGSFDPTWASKLIPDVDWDRVRVIHPEPGLEGVQIMTEIAKSGEASIMVYDSLGAMLDESEMKDDDPRPRVGRAATLITFMAQSITVPCDRNGTTAILVNQVRDDVGGPNNFVSFHSPGGRAVKHQAAMRIKLKRVSGESYKVKQPGPVGKPVDLEVGFRVSAQMEKNKAAEPKNMAYWNFYNRPLRYLGEKKVELDPAGMIGIDRQQEILDLAVNHGVIEQAAGGYYGHSTFPEDKQGKNRIRGKENLFDYLREDSKSNEEIKRELMVLAQRKGGK